MGPNFHVFMQASSGSRSSWPKLAEKASQLAQKELLKNKDSRAD